jgi:hypothetical protein
LSIAGGVPVAARRAAVAIDRTFFTFVSEAGRIIVLTACCKRHGDAPGGLRFPAITNGCAEVSTASITIL